jgi:hypothetical protein
VGFFAEDGDVKLRGVLEDLLDAGDAGHSIPDDDQSVHALCTCLAVDSLRKKLRRADLAAD